MLQVLRGYPRLFQCVTARVPPSTTCFLPRTKVQQRKSLGIFSTNLAGNESEHVSLNSQIEWTDATWNPVRGCTKISPGCKHCYAETFAERFRGVKGHPYEQGFELRLVSIETLLEDLGEIDLSGIDWVIVGGESGPGARPMNKEWVLSIREQCRSYEIPFFFKQWGGVRKRRNGRVLEGRTYDEYPHRNPAPMPDKQKRATFAEHFFQSFRQLFCNDKALVQVTS